MAEKKPAKKTKVAAAKAKAAAKAAAAKEKNVVKRVNRQASGFADFIRTQNIVALAVGLAIGSSATITVKTIVEDIVTPVVNFIIGTHGHLETQEWYVHLWGRDAHLKWGEAVSSLITLVATVYVIYLIVHFARLERLRKQD